MRPTPEPIEAKTSALPATGDRIGLVEPLRLAAGVTVEGDRVRGPHASIAINAEEAVVLSFLRAPKSVEELCRDNVRSPQGVRPAMIVRTLLRLQEAGLLAGHTGALAARVPGTRWLTRALGRWPRLTWVWLPALTVVAAVALLGAWAQRPELLRAPMTLRSTEVVALTVVVPLLLLLWRAFVRGLAAQAVGMPGAAQTMRLRWQAGAELTDANLTPVERLRAQAVAWAGLGAIALPLVVTAGVSVAAPLLPISGHLALVTWLSALLFLLSTAPSLPSDARTLANLSRATPVLGRHARAWLSGRAVWNLLRFRPMSPLEEGYARVATVLMAHALLAWLVTTRCLLPFSLTLVTHAMRAGESIVAALPVALAVVWLLALTLGLVALLWGFVRPLWSLARIPRRAVPVALDALEPGQVHVVRRGAWQLPFFAKLGPAAVENLPSLMRRETYVDGQTILRQGDPGDRICCLTTGNAMVEVEDAAGLRHLVARLNHADFFGETAILSPTPRTAHVIADGKTVIASMDRDTFLQLVAQSGVNHDEVLRQVRVTAALRGHPLFDGVKPAQLTALVQATLWHTLPAGATLVTEGEAQRDLYLLLEGQCIVRHAGRDVGQLGPLDWFGELGLLTDGPRQASVTALTPVSVLQIPEEAALGGLAQEAVPAQRLWQVAAERLQTAREAQ